MRAFGKENVQLSGNVRQPAITGPEQGSGSGTGRRQELGIDKPNASSVNLRFGNESEHRIVPDHGRLRHGCEELQDFITIAQGTESQLTCHPWMHKHLAILQKKHHRQVTLAKMIDPHRGVNQDHEASPRLR